MDFKYIEQLLQRYFAAETSAQEEDILRTFFSQDEMPDHLRRWQPLFQQQDALSHTHLDERFDEHILEQIGEHHVHALRIPLRQRLRPLFSAAAFIAFAVVIGSAVEHSTNADTVGTSQPTTAVAQDELDPSETTPLDIRSAEVTDTPIPLTSVDSMRVTD